MRLTEEEYLALDRAADYKSEFVDGEMYAMAGVGLRHSSLGVRMICGLVMTLHGRNCEVFNADVRVRAAKTGSYLYPDVSVVCGAVETYQGTDDILANPSVIVEVLSPSTADYDHGKKFAIYREIPSLNDYLLVHTDEVLIGQYVRRNDGKWLLSDHEGIEATVHLGSIDCTLHLKDNYEAALKWGARGKSLVHFLPRSLAEYPTDPPSRKS